MKKTVQRLLELEDKLASEGLTPEEKLEYWALLKGHQDEASDQG